MKLIDQTKFCRTCGVEDVSDGHTCPETTNGVVVVPIEFGNHDSIAYWKAQTTLQERIQQWKANNPNLAA